MEKYFKDLSLASKAKFTDKFQVLPYPNYAIRKALTECDAIIMNAECRIDVWFLSAKSSENFFNRLIANAK